MSACKWATLRDEYRVTEETDDQEPRLHATSAPVDATFRVCSWNINWQSACDKGLFEHLRKKMTYWRSSGCLVLAGDQGPRQSDKPVLVVEELLVLGNRHITSSWSPANNTVLLEYSLHRSIRLLFCLRALPSGVELSPFE